MSKVAGGAEPSGLTAAAIRDAVGPGHPFGEPIEVYPVAVTAESLALSWARQRGAPEGAVVVVEQELSARARRGPPWVSVAGKSLAFSVVLRPDLPAEGEGLLWLLASVGAAEGIEGATGLSVPVKWPDDLLVGGLRVGCVKVDAHLAPGRVESAVLTVRVNGSLAEEDFPPAVRPAATSLSGQGADRPGAVLVAAILRWLERRYAAPVAELLEAYRSRCDTLGRAVRAHLMPVGELAGTAEDVDERGALRIRGPGGSHAIAVDQLKRLEIAAGDQT